jgi:hypothetical protein
MGVVEVSDIDDAEPTQSDMSSPPQDDVREAAGREAEPGPAAAAGAATAASAAETAGWEVARLGSSGAAEAAATASGAGGRGAGGDDGGDAEGAGGSGKSGRGTGNSQMACWTQPQRSGYVPIVVRYAPISSWQQRTLYVRKDTNSDSLKWALKNDLGAGPSMWRVHEGYRGDPYDRYTPVATHPRRDPSDTTGGSRVDGSGTSAPLFIAPSFGP